MKYINDIYSDYIYHWMMFIKHNNMMFLQKDSLNIPINKIEHEVSEEGFDSYHNIRDQIIQEFGLDDSIEEERIFEEEIALLKLDYIISKDGFKQTLYQLKEAERPEKEESETYDFNREIGIVSKSLGGGIIDIKKTTIHQYYTAKNSVRNG